MHGSPVGGAEPTGQFVSIVLKSTISSYSKSWPTPIRTARQEILDVRRNRCHVLSTFGEGDELAERSQSVTRGPPWTNESWESL